MSLFNKTSEREEKPQAKQDGEVRESVRKRVPLVSTDSQLDVPHELREAYPDHSFRWVNDEKGRVQKFLNAGWEVCEGVNVSGSMFSDDAGKAGQTASVVMRPVGQGQTTSNLQMVLMMTTKEIFKEDFDKQQELNQQYKQALRQGANQSGVGGKSVSPDGGTYAPELDDGKTGFSESNPSRTIE